MLKKRLIFCLLYKDGYFVQSRNFVTNIIGDTDWIIKNYNFTNISNFIDELIIIDISKNKKKEIFLKNVERIIKKSFIPLSLGGGIDNMETAKLFLENMCDKVLINTSLFENSKLISEIANRYGNQSIVASTDYKIEKKERVFFKKNGTKKIDMNFINVIKYVQKMPIGEFMINSIDRDGTGQGLDIVIIKYLKESNKPTIISGGAGNYKHFIKILSSKKISAISTSNLLNFVGDGLKILREELIKKEIDLPVWG